MAKFFEEFEFGQICIRNYFEPRHYVTTFRATTVRHNSSRIDMTSKKSVSIDQRYSSWIAIDYLTRNETPVGNAQSLR